jgi:hypothetical protein
LKEGAAAIKAMTDNLKSRLEDLLAPVRFPFHHLGAELPGFFVALRTLGMDGASVGAVKSESSSRLRAAFRGPNSLEEFTAAVSTLYVVSSGSADAATLAEAARLISRRISKDKLLPKLTRPQLNGLRDLFRNTGVEDGSVLVAREQEEREKQAKAGETSVLTEMSSRKAKAKGDGGPDPVSEKVAENLGRAFPGAVRKVANKLGWRFENLRDATQPNGVQRKLQATLIAGGPQVEWREVAQAMIVASRMLGAYEDYLDDNDAEPAPRFVQAKKDIRAVIDELIEQRNEDWIKLVELNPYLVRAVKRVGYSNGSEKRSPYSPDVQRKPNAAPIVVVVPDPGDSRNSTSELSPADGWYGTSLLTPLKGEAPPSPYAETNTNVNTFAQRT